MPAIHMVGWVDSNAGGEFSGGKEGARGKKRGENIQDSHRQEGSPRWGVGQSLQFPPSGEVGQRPLGGWVSPRPLLAVTQQQLEETRQALKELGLPDLLDVD